SLLCFTGFYGLPWCPKLTVRDLLFHWHLHFQSVKHFREMERSRNGEKEGKWVGQRGQVMVNLQAFRYEFAGVLELEM
ncbi:hypothetical protein M8C21_015002, partial [Ambrosia artemisiifolia]